MPTSAGRIRVGRPGAPCVSFAVRMFPNDATPIDYVITHELCHMRHNHHGGAFFHLLDRVMPDWEKRH